MARLTFKQRCFGWASGHYLAEEVDVNFWKLDIEDQYQYCEDNAWEPFEDYRGKDVHGWINQLARDIELGQFPMKGDGFDQEEDNLASQDGL